MADYRPRPTCYHCLRPATERCDECDDITCEVCECSCEDDLEACGLCGLRAAGPDGEPCCGCA